MKTGLIHASLISLIIGFGFAGTVAAAEHTGDAKSGFQKSQLSTVFSGNLSTGKSHEKDGAQADRRLSLIDRQSDMFRVLSVLEKRIDNELLDKVRHKLPSLNEKRLQMLASLSDRMAGSSQGPENNIAFLLIATLIIFS